MRIIGAKMKIERARAAISSLALGIALFIALLLAASPASARAATCVIDFSVAYNSPATSHVMSRTQNFDELSACDPRFVANQWDPASGFSPFVQSGPTAYGGSFSTQVNTNDDTIVYTPATGFSGVDTFVVFFCNDPGCTAAGRIVGTVSVTVGPAPSPPIASSGGAIVAYNSGANPITLHITGGTPTSVAVLMQAANGTATAVGTSITYTPNAGFTGPDSFVYTATNAEGTSAPAIVTIAVTPPLPPITAAVGLAVTANSVGNPVALNITGGAPVSLATPTAPAHGSVTVTGTTITYTPTAGYSGPDSFTYTATNPGGTSAPSTVTISVAPPTLTLSAITTTGQVATAYSSTISTSLGTAPYSYALTGGVLPAGITLSTSGVLSGTPTAADMFISKIEATDAHGATGHAIYVIVVSAPAVAITNPLTGALPPAEAHETYSQTFTATGGIGPRSFALTGGALPPGLSLTSGGVLSGAPTTPGTYNFTITPSDGSAAPGPYAGTPVVYSITVTAPTIALAPAARALPAATTALAYSQTFTAGGGIGPYSYSLTAGTLPPGISFTSGGVFSGTPTAAGTYNFTITADDSHGFDVANAYSITVSNPVIAVTSPAAGVLPSVTAYDTYSQTFAATGGIGPRSFALTAGALPPGVSFTSGGVLSGTPTTPGTYNFSIAASDSSGAPGPFVSAPAAYSVTVSAPTVTLTPAAGVLPDAIASTAYNQTFTAGGGNGTHTFAVTAGALPPGISFTSAGVLSGTPTTPGTYNFTLVASDTSGAPGPYSSPAAAYSLTVAAPTVTIVTPVSGALPNVVAYTPINHAFTATGGLGPRSFALTAGALPPGVSFTSGGVLSGTPTAAGTYNFTLAASDSSGAPGPFVSAPAAYSVTVAAPTVAIDTPVAGALPDAIASVAYNQTFTASGGSGSHTFAVTAGALPPGMSFTSAGLLSGTPTTPGSYSFTLVASDTSGAPGPYSSSAVAYSLTVAAPTVTIVTPLSGALPSVVAYTPINHAFTATGGLGPRSFSLVAGALPAGVSFTSGGVLSGAPTTPGTYNFSIAASDSSGAPGPFVSATVAYSLTVSAPTITLTPATLTNGTTGDPYAQPLTAAGGTAAYGYSVTAGALPAGIALAAGGSLSGTPTTAGTYNFTVTVTDANGFSAANAYALVVIDASPVAAADTASTPANQAVTIPVTANDTGVITSVAVAGAPAHGTAVVSGLDVAYTPAANYFGTDSFTYRAAGPGGTSAPATVTVTVTPLAVPTAAAKALTVLSGQTGSLDATVGSTGAPITTVAVAAAPAHGTATVSGVNLTYSPAAGYSGTDSFTYTLANPFGVSAPATVTVTVNPAPITAAPITVEILAGQTATANLTGAATGGPFTGAAVVTLTPPTSGTAAITSPGAGQYVLVFTPSDTFAGTATATYTLSNAYATSAPGTVTIIVTARPDPTSDPEVTGLVGAQGESARRFATAQIGNFNSRLESLRDGGGGGTSLSLGFSGGSRDLTEELDSTTRRRIAELGLLEPERVGYGYAGGDASDASNGYVGRTEGGRVGLWAAGMVDFGRHDTSIQQKGVKFTTDGLTAGADVRFSDQLVIGAGVGWGHDQSRIGNNGTRSEADSYSFAIYGSYQPDTTFFVDGVLGHGALEYDSRRYITATGDFAFGQRDGSQWFGAVTGGWDMREGRWLLSPYGRLSATRSVLDAFSETSGGAYALSYDSQTVRTLTGTFGLRGAYGYETSFGEVTPRFRFEYSHDFQGVSRANLFYVDWVGGPVYGVSPDPLAQDRALGGLGLDVLTVGASRFSFDYEIMVGDGLEQHQARVQIRTRF